MTTYMAIAKGEKAKSLRERRWVLQMDQTLDTPIKMSSENSPQKQSKNLFYSHKRKEAKDRRDVSLLLTSLVQRRRLLLFFFFSSSRVQIPSGVLRPLPRGASRGSRTVHFCFSHKRSNSVCL
jgi:hypothetical protein